MEKSTNEKNRFYQLLKRALPKYDQPKSQKGVEKKDDGYNEKRTRQRKSANTSR